MSLCLFTVKEVYMGSQGITLLPGFKLNDTRPEVQSIIQGIDIDLRRPDGTHLVTQLVNYGIAVEKDAAGNIILRGDPEDQYVHVILPREVELHDVPLGTEVWINNQKEV